MNCQGLSLLPLREDKGGETKRLRVVDGDDIFPLIEANPGHPRSRKLCVTPQKCPNLNRIAMSGKFIEVRHPSPIPIIRYFGPRRTDSFPVFG